jgi:hypothetical protein
MNTPSTLVATSTSSPAPLNFLSSRETFHYPLRSQIFRILPCYANKPVSYHIHTVSPSPEPHLVMLGTRNLPKKVERKYQGGEAYGDPKKVETGVLEDLRSLGSLDEAMTSIGTLVELLRQRGKPIDDRKMVVRLFPHILCIV